MIRVDAAWLAVEPIDMRAGVDKALARVVDVPNLALRVHRALSWLNRAEPLAEDRDGHFIFLWIAFNAGYASDLTDDSQIALLFDASAASVNACAYRSPKISEEPNNRKLVKTLPSVALHRRWLIEVALPDANAGKRLIIGKLYGLWNLPVAVTTSNGNIADPAPISPNISSEAFDRVRRFLEESSDAP